MYGLFGRMGESFVFFEGDGKEECELFLIDCGHSSAILIVLEHDCGVNMRLETSFGNDNC